MPRLDRQGKKRADLEMLSTLLQMSQMYGPEQETRELLGEETLREAQLRNQGLETQLPFLGRESEARIGTQEDERGYARERHPVAMKGLGAQVAGQELDNVFNQRTMDPRVSAVGTAARQAEQLSPYLVGGAEQQLRRGEQMLPLEAAESQAKTNYYTTQNEQSKKEFPLTQDFTRAKLGDTYQQQALTTGQHFNVMDWLRPQQELGMPEAVDPNAPKGLSDAQLFQQLTRAGYRPEEIATIIQRIKQGHGP